MKVVVTDETGLVKRVEFGHAAETPAAVVKHRTQDRALAPVAIAFDRAGEAVERCVILGLTDGSIELLDLETSARTELLPAGTFAEPIVGLDGNDERLVVADASGTVKLWRRAESAGALGEPDVSFNASSHATKMVVCPDNDSLLAIGGKDCELRVWNMTDFAGGHVFKSKNVKPDKLYLHAPKHITDIAFVPGTDGTQVVVGTAYKQVRRYDSKVQSRPMFSADAGEHAVSCVCVTPDGAHIVAGDVAGGLFLLNLQTGERVAKFKGVAGGCRSVVCHATLDLMACCGLDRHVKIYSVSNRLCRRKVYLKQRLNVVLFGQDGDLDTAQPAPDGELGDGQAAATPEEEEDAVWEELEASAATKKHKSKSDGSAGPKRRRTEKQVKE